MTLSSRTHAVPDHTRYYSGTLQIDKTDVWTWARCPLTPFSFLDFDRRRQIGWAHTMALASMPQVLRFKVIQKPTDPSAWKEQRDFASLQTKNRSPVWPKYLDAQTQRIQQVEKNRKAVYLGVYLGQRKFMDQFLAAAPSVVSRLFRRSVIGELTEGEIEFWESQAAQVQRELAGTVYRTQSLSTEEYRWLRRHSLYRALEQTDTDTPTWKHYGAGEPIDDFSDIELTPVASVGKGVHTCVRIDTPTGSTYSATFVISRMPLDMLFPVVQPWLAHLDRITDFVTEADLFLDVQNMDKASRDLVRRLNSARDQERDARKAHADIPLQLEEILRVAKEQQFLLEKRRLPLVYGMARVRVEASSLEELTERYKRLRKHYAEMSTTSGHIELTWPGGQAQLDLLLEGIPGRKLAQKSYTKRWLLETAAAALPTASSGLSDSVGPYRGYTNGRVRQAVTWSPWGALTGKQNAPAGTLLIGNSGAGKSTALGMAAFDSIMEGAHTVVLDPSGPLAGLANLPEIRDRCVVHNLLHGSVLDPLSPRVIADPAPTGDPLKDEVAWTRTWALREELAREILYLIANRQINARPEAETEMLTALSDIVSGKFGTPSLPLVIQRLQEGNSHAQLLYQHYSALARTTRGGQIVFGDVTQTPAMDSVEKVGTFFIMPGLAMPKADAPMSAWTPKQCVGAAALHLATQFGQRMLWELPKNVSKLLIVDEGRVILATDSGWDTIEKFLRDGRKRRAALLLAVHAAVDVDNEKLVSNFSTRLLFRTSGLEEVQRGLKLLEIEDTVENRQYVSDMSNGQCLAVFPNGIRDRFQWDRSFWTPDLVTALDTRPEETEAPVLEVVA